MEPDTPHTTLPTTTEEQSPVAIPNAANGGVVDVTDVMDLVDIEDDKEMPCTPPAVRSQCKRRRRFVESRDGQ